MKSKTGGLILLNKPSGITSFKALNSLKKKLGTGKVGHTGTLDKFADGLIVALYGKMTKLVPEFTGMNKEYIAEIQFGTETDTLDPEGHVIATSEPPELNTIVASIPYFTGKIQQTPPQYSAIHINGKRAYELVRSGKDFEIPSREIEVFSFEIISYDQPRLIAKIRCSKGTYIRSLARDLALECQSRAHLISLKRTEVGPFEISDSILPDNFSQETDIIHPREIFDYLPHIKEVEIDDKYIEDIKVGKEQILNLLSHNFEFFGEYALFDRNSNMLAMVKKNDKGLSYRFVC